MLSKELRCQKIEITLDRYISLLESEIELRALEGEGVDNWIGWGTAQQNYIQHYVETNPIFTKQIGLSEEDVLDDIDLRTIAEYEGLIALEQYEMIKAEGQ